MTSEVLIKKSLIIYAILFVALVSFSAENKLEKETDISKITQILNSRTNGNNPFYLQVLSPAQSLEVDKSKSDRIHNVNEKMISEFTQILTIFKQTAEDKKLAAVNAAAVTLDSELVKSGGAYITFLDGIPSAAFSRTFLMVSKKNNKVKVAAEQIFNLLTSYKRSPKPSDHVYEYPFADNLTQGSAKYVQGGENTWKGEGAAEPFSFDKDIVLKKCRQLLGWRCATSLYHADRFLKASESAQTLFIATYDLEKNPDNPEFAKDKRSVNQYTGSTAMYVVKESSDWILLYGVDAQWNEGKLSFQGAIQNEFKKDFDRFKERMRSELQIIL